MARDGSDIVERLRDWTRMTPAACKEAADEIERLRAALEDVVTWADELGYYAEPGSELAPVFQRAKAALKPKL